MSRDSALLAVWQNGSLDVYKPGKTVVLAKRPVIDIDRTVTLPNDLVSAEAIITNKSASADISIILPVAEAGNHITIVNVSDSNNITIVPSSGSLEVNGTATTAYTVETKHILQLFGFEDEWIGMSSKTT